MERTQFARPIGSFHLVQRKLNLMLTEITAAQLLNLRVGRLATRFHVHLLVYADPSLPGLDYCIL